MSHLLLFYLLLSFVIGGSSLVLLLILQMSRIGQSVERYRTLFTGVFTCILVFQIIVEYFRNTGLQGGWFFPVILAVSDISVFILIFVLPLYVHELRDVPFKTIMNTILGCIASALIVFRLVPLPNFIDSFIINIGGMLFYSIIIYSCLVILMYRDKRTSRSSSSPQEIAAGCTIIFIFLMFFFTLTVDVSLSVGTFLSVNSLFFSSYYIVYSIVTLFHGFDSLRTAKKPEKTDTPLVDLHSLYGVTEREIEIIRHLVSGKSYREIGELLFISVDTVKTHTQNIYKKLHVNNKIGLVKRLNDLNAQGFADA